METLADRVARDGALNELDAVGWIIRLAKRLEALHAVGVAHGSVSPACVLVAGTDRTSRAAMADVRRTPTDVAYYSPERINGQGISTSDDVWALAATLYAVLTGSPPFGAKTDPDVRSKIVGGSAAPLAVFDVGDDDLQKIVDEGLQRDPARRTKSVSALRRELENWHPDPGAKQLAPLEDEDADDDDDDDDVRTVMRSPGEVPAPVRAALGRVAPAAPRPAAGAPARPAAGPAPRPAIGAAPGSRPGVPAAPGSRPGVPAAPGSRPGVPAPPGSRPGAAAAPPAARPFAAPAKPAAPQQQVDHLMEEDEDERTVMRNYPLPAAAFRAGAPSALRVADEPSSASLPTPIAPRPDAGAIADDDSDDGDDERTVMRAAPVPLGDDDDDDGAKTVMREAFDPGALAQMPGAPKPVIPAPTGSRPGAASPPAVAPMADDTGRSTPTTALPAETFSAPGPLPAAGSPAQAPARHPFGDAPLDGGATVALPVDDFGAQPLRGDATVAFPAPSGAAAPNLGAPPPSPALAPAPAPALAPAPSPAPAPAPATQALAAPAAPPKKKSAALVVVVAILALVVAGMVTFLVLHARKASGELPRPTTHVRV